ncbi:MAG: hypothetical protein HRU75_13055 [Planctomycetia bacterium]|nr:MAG: hypothetical protein HRU75_13055 [Planctomycetia bacterium]
MEAAETLRDALPAEVRWQAASGAPAALATLPAAPAVYLLTDEHGSAVQLATTQHLRSAVTARLAPPAAEGAAQPTGTASGRRAELASVVRAVRWREVGGAFEARWRYYRACRDAWPRRYRELLPFAPAAFLHFVSGREVPEIRVSERVYADGDAYIGPWSLPGEAQRALEGLQDLFELCRYPAEVRRAPAGRRCPYADMGRCDAPCDGSAPMERYAARVSAAWRFVCGQTEECNLDVQSRMARAAAGLRFEEAGVLKRQAEFIRRWQRDTAPRILSAADWCLWFATRVARRQAWTMHLFDRGALRVQGPVAAKRLAAEAPGWIAATLREIDGSPSPEDPALRMEQAWLVAQWLGGSAAERSIQMRLPGRCSPADAVERIAARLAALQRSAARSVAEPIQEAIAETDESGNAEAISLPALAQQDAPEPSS